MKCPNCGAIIKDTRALASHILSLESNHSIGAVRWATKYMKRPLTKGRMDKDDFYREMRKREGDVSLSK